jgi:hypothetical protein
MPGIYFKTGSTSTEGPGPSPNLLSPLISTFTRDLLSTTDR